VKQIVANYVVDDGNRSFVSSALRLSSKTEHIEIK